MKSFKQFLADRQEGITSEEAARIIASDYDMFYDICDYTAADPDIFLHKPEQARKIAEILHLIIPFESYVGTFYRGEPRDNQQTKRNYGFRSWSANMSTAKSFVSEYPDGVLVTKTGKIQAVSIEQLCVARMRISKESHYAGLQAEYLIAD